MVKLGTLIDCFQWCVFGSTRLHSAAIQGDCEKAEKLISKGAMVDIRQRNDGRTPLHQAVINGNTIMVITLLGMGADKNLQDKNGDTPLHRAALMKENEIMNILSSNGGDTNVNIKNANGLTVLHVFACTINYPPAKLLNVLKEFHKDKELFGGEEFHDDEFYNDTILRSLDDVISILPTKMILEQGADVNAKDNEGRTPLHYLAYQNTDKLDFVNLELVYNLDLPEPEKYDLLFEKREKSLFELLMSYRADVNAKDNDSQTPLHAAVFKGNENMVNMLLSHGADIKAVNKSGETVLHYAARSKEEVQSITRLLLSAGARVNASDTEGRTPLHYLAEFGDVGISEILLSSGADINANDDNGKTPLHYAAESGYAGCVEFLLSKGADINAKTFDGETPLDRALAWHETPVVKILLFNNAKRHALISSLSTKKTTLNRHVLTPESGHSKNQDIREKIFLQENKILFSSNEVTRLRQYAMQAGDPMALLSVFTSLRIKNGFTLCSFPFDVFEGTVGNVWAVPSSLDMPKPEDFEIIDLFELPRPFPTDNTCLDGLTMYPTWRSPKLLRPPDALDNVMEAIEGDGTPYSYLSASIFAREITEFGARWHGCIWSNHVILAEAPWTCPHISVKDIKPSPEKNWNWSIPKPSEWNPSVVYTDEVITVRFFTYTDFVQEAIHCYTDIYRPNDYRFEWDVKIITGEIGKGYRY